MNIGTMRTHLKNSLAGPSAKWSDGELDRGVSEAVADLSRLFPLELIYETTWTKAVASETFTTNHDTYVTLAVKPINPGSEVVKIGSTTHELDDDYEMDYINGKIKVLSSGDMANSTSATITFDRAAVVIDLASELTNPMRILRVEVPLDNVPQAFASYELHGDFLILLGIGQETKSQSGLADKYHIRIYYQSQQTDPGSSANGSFPRYLDELVIKGASGYILRIEAIKQIHNTTRYAMNANTELATMAKMFRDINTWLEQADADTLEARTASNSINAEIALANTAADNMSTELGKVRPQLNLMIAEAGRVWKILARVAQTSTAILSPSQVRSQLSAFELAANRIMKFADEAFDTSLNTGELKDARDIHTILVRKLNQAGIDVIKVESKIDNVNEGADVPGNYVSIAGMSLEIARQYGDRRRDFISSAGRFIEIAQAFAGEANARIARITASSGAAQVYLQEAAAAMRIVDVSATYVQQLLLAVQGYNEEALRRMETAQAYEREALSNLANAQGWINISGTKLLEIEAKAAKADRFMALSERLQTSVVLLKQESDIRLSEFHRDLRDRHQTYSHEPISSIFQHPT